MMKLAVKKEPGSIPLAGYHYYVIPIELSDDQAALFELTGHIIIEIENTVGQRIVEDACKALRHQCEIANFAEKELLREK